MHNLVNFKRRKLTSSHKYINNPLWWNKYGGKKFWYFCFFTQGLHIEFFMSRLSVCFAQVIIKPWLYSFSLGVSTLNIYLYSNIYLFFPHWRHGLSFNPTSSKSLNSICERINFWCICHGELNVRHVLWGPPALQLSLFSSPGMWSAGRMCL